MDKLHERHVIVKGEAEKQIDECVRDPYNFDIWLLFNTSLTASSIDTN